MNENDDTRRLRARRLPGGDVEVDGSGNTEGWRFIVYAADRGVRVIPPVGDRVNRESWRAVPIGRILRAADELTTDDRVDLTLSRLPKLRRPSPEQRDYIIAAAYRQALLASVPPREVVARLLGVEQDRAGREITRLRNAGLIDSVHDERRRLAEKARR